MDATEAIQLYRTNKYCYHGLIRSPMRCGYIEGCKKFKVIYSTDCENTEGGHQHMHYLFVTDIGPGAMKKRLQRVEKQKDGEYNRLLQVTCEVWFMQVIHYLHCSQGQKYTHRHVHSEGVLNEKYVHRYGIQLCGGTKTMLKELTAPVHPDDCPCKTRRKTWISGINKKRVAIQEKKIEQETYRAACAARRAEYQKKKKEEEEKKKQEEAKSNKEQFTNLIQDINFDEELVEADSSDDSSEEEIIYDMYDLE